LIPVKPPVVSFAEPLVEVPPMVTPLLEAPPLLEALPPVFGWNATPAEPLWECPSEPACPPQARANASEPSANIPFGPCPISAPNTAQP
jgi:hypothetical protein